MPTLPVTVIIPAFNSCRYIGEALESVLRQGTPAREVLVIDDGSTDGTRCEVMRFPRVRYARQPHAGPGAARNHGVELASCEFLAFLDSDDVWLPDKLARQWEVLAHPGAPDMVFGTVEQFVTPELDARSDFRIRPEAARAPHVGTLLIPAATFDRVGRFTTRPAAGEFIDWYARALDLGLRSLTLPEVVMRRRLHRESLTSRQGPGGPDYLAVLRSVVQRRRGQAQSCAEE